MQLGMPENSLSKIAETVISDYGEVYPCLLYTSGAARKRIEKLRIGGASFCCEHDCIGGKFRCASLKPVNRVRNKSFRCV